MYSFCNTDLYCRYKDSSDHSQGKKCVASFTDMNTDSWLDAVAGYQYDHDASPMACIPNDAEQNARNNTCLQFLNDFHFWTFNKTQVECQLDGKPIVWSDYDGSLNGNTNNACGLVTSNEATIPSNDQFFCKEQTNGTYEITEQSATNKPTTDGEKKYSSKNLPFLCRPDNLKLKSNLFDVEWLIYNEDYQVSILEAANGMSPNQKGTLQEFTRRAFHVCRFNKGFNQLVSSLNNEELV